MITCMNIIEPLNEPQCFYLLGLHMAAPSHKMQMFFFCVVIVIVVVNDCAVRPSYVTVLYRQNGRHLLGLFV